MDFFVEQQITLSFLHPQEKENSNRSSSHSPPMADDHCYWPGIRRMAAPIGFASHAYADLDRQLMQAEAEFHRRSVRQGEKQKELEKLVNLKDAETLFHGSGSDEEEQLDEREKWYRTFKLGIPDMKFTDRTELEEKGLLGDGESLDELIAAATEKYEKAKTLADECEDIFGKLEDEKREVKVTLEELESDLLEHVKSVSEKMEPWVKLVGFSDLAAVRFIKKMNKEGELDMELLFCLGKKLEAGMRVKLAELSEEEIGQVKRGRLYRLTVDGSIKMLTDEEMEAVGFP